MSTSRPIMQAGPGRSVLIGGPVVLAGLLGLFLSLRHNKQKEVEAGKNPHFEQILAHVGKKPAGDEDLKPLRSYSSDLPPNLPGDDHYSGHSTRTNWKNTQGYAEHGDDVRYMQPTPQREASDGSGRAYTKSPDYAKNYGKTQRPEPLS
ncbi:hypothetical protein BJ912DRAFT_120205 [Pholiota molesta]|nr:hypothetical protein BJ912DRAFT_120205 [Pholiota molesta]